LCNRRDESVLVVMGRINQRFIWQCKELLPHALIKRLGISVLEVSATATFGT
jgi:hypothetical protein